MASLDYTTYHVIITNTSLRTLIKGGDRWVSLPNGDELHIEGGHLSEKFAEQIVEYLQFEYDLHD